MRGFLVAILLGTVAMSAAQDPNIPKDLKTFWLMYYVKAEDGPTLSQEQSAEYMPTHLGNMERLAEQNALYAAGPFAGDGDPRRGITLLSTDRFDSVEAIRKEFAAHDKLVQSGYFRVEAHKLWCSASAVTKPPEPIEMQAYVFVTYYRGGATDLSEQELARLQSEHLAHNMLMKREHGLGWVGPLENAGEARGILLFRHDNVGKAREIVFEDPLVKAGRLYPEFRVVWMARGVAG